MLKKYPRRSYVHTELVPRLGANLPMKGSSHTEPTCRSWEDSFSVSLPPTQPLTHSQHTEISAKTLPEHKGQPSVATHMRITPLAKRVRTLMKQMAHYSLRQLGKEVKSWGREERDFPSYHIITVKQPVFRTKQRALKSTLF